MRNRPALNNILIALLLVATSGLTIYWTAPALRGQVAANHQPINPTNAPSNHSVQIPQVNAAAHQAASTALQGMPLAFTENRGQADERVAFHVQGRDTATYFTAQGITVSFTGQQPTNTPQIQNASLVTKFGQNHTRQRWNLKLDFIGANPDAKPIGLTPAAAPVSYFSGPLQYLCTGTPTYSAIA